MFNTIILVVLILSSTEHVTAKPLVWKGGEKYLQVFYILCCNMTADFKKLEKGLKDNPNTEKKLFLDISAAQYS